MTESLANALFYVKRIKRPLNCLAAGEDKITDMKGTSEIRKERLLQLLASFKGNQAEFADIAGLSPSYLSQIKRGIRPIPADKCRELERKFKRPAFWFDSEQDAEPNSFGKWLISPNPKYNGAEFDRIEFYNVEGSCGEGSNVYPSSDDAPHKFLIKEASWFTKYQVKPSDLFAIYARGDSNAEFICDGDMVIFDKSKTLPVSGKIFLLHHPDGLKIKLLRQTLSGWNIESKNPAYSPEVVTNDIAENLQIIGQFVYRQGA